SSAGEIKVHQEWRVQRKLIFPNQAGQEGVVNTLTTSHDPLVFWRGRKADAGRGVRTVRVYPSLTGHTSAPPQPERRHCLRIICGRCSCYWIKVCQPVVGLVRW